MGNGQFLIENPQGVCMEKYFLNILDSFWYIEPFGPIFLFVFRQTNHTNLTRRIDPRYPEPANSVVSSNNLFSFFRFLGFEGRA